MGTMLVAMFTIHIHNGFSAVNTIGLTPAGPLFGPPGFEINLLYIAALLALALSPPTAASVDAMRAHRREATEKTSPLRFAIDEYGNRSTGCPTDR